MRAPLQRFYLAAVAAVLVLVIGFVAIIVTSLIPYFGVIGKMASVVVGVGLFCLCLLMISFTWLKIGVWGNRRHLLISGEVVAFVDRSGAIVHLSAQHEAAKVPLPQTVVKELPSPSEQAPTMDDETVRELHQKGLSNRDIAKATGMTYYAIQKITSEKRD